jgi:hypothetical protein
VGSNWASREVLEPQSSRSELAHRDLLGLLTMHQYTGFVQGGLNSAVDLFLTILPATIFWSLKISKYLKIGLGVLLSLSIL